MKIHKPAIIPKFPKRISHPRKAKNNKSLKEDSSLSSADASLFSSKGSSYYTDNDKIEYINSSKSEKSDSSKRCSSSDISSTPSRISDISKSSGYQTDVDRKKIENFNLKN